MHVPQQQQRKKNGGKPIFHFSIVRACVRACLWEKEKENREDRQREYLIYGREEHSPILNAIMQNTIDTIKDNRPME